MHYCVVQKEFNCEESSNSKSVKEPGYKSFKIISKGNVRHISSIGLLNINLIMGGPP